jgi:glycosyltransferase involved in cell wall biosynthesis
VVGDAGLLVPVRDSPAIGRAIKRLVDDPELRRSLGAAARRRVAENFTWSVVARRYVEEYERHGRSSDAFKLRVSHDALAVQPTASTRS